MPKLVIILLQMSPLPFCLLPIFTLASSFDFSPLFSESMPYGFIYICGFTKKCLSTLSWQADTS